MENSKEKYIGSTALAGAPCSATCGKCGGTDICRKFWRAGEDTHGQMPCDRWPTTEWVDRSDRYVKPARKECIVHRCRVCGYQWDSDVLPNAPHEPRGAKTND